MLPDSTAYDEANRPTEAVDFDWLSVDPELREAALRGFDEGFAAGKAEGKRWVLRVLFRDAKSVEQIGRRACNLGYAETMPDAPASSVRELANLFGVSAARAHETLTELRQILSEMPSD